MFEPPKSDEVKQEPALNSNPVSVTPSKTVIELPTTQIGTPTEGSEAEYRVEMPMLYPSEDDQTEDVQSISTTGAPQDERRGKPKRPWWRELLSWFLYIIIPVAIAILLNTYVAGLVRVQGDSMIPSLTSGDILIISRLSSPARGAVVVFPHEGVELVKRVIATEGQTVRIDYSANAVFVDNQRLDEPYIDLSDDDPMEDHGGETEWVVPIGSVFVMGDNRNSSNDSRNFGPVEKSEIMGVLLLRIPIGEWRR